MSLEDSMAKLADSNLKLAQSLDNYAATIDKYGLKIAADNGDAAAAPVVDKPRGRGKKADAPAPAPAGDGFSDDDAGFGDDAAAVPEKITADMMKAKLIEVRDAYGDKAPALKIINAYGYNAIPEVKPADYAKVWADCDKAIAAKK
jgi:hypothetical protein